VLFWLNLLAAKRQSVASIVRDHWRRFGRDFYTRHDYEGLQEDGARALMDHLRRRLDTLPGQRLGDYTVTHADDFAYTDPVDGSQGRGQGIRLLFGDTARLVFRLSGTGTSGATLRVYAERFEVDAARHGDTAQTALEPLLAVAREVADIPGHTGREAPDVVT
jgi:phosphoglucomutase